MNMNIISLLLLLLLIIILLINSTLSFHRKVDQRRSYIGNTLLDTDEVRDYRRSNKYIHEYNILIDFVFVITKAQALKSRSLIKEWKDIVIKYHSIFLLEDGIDDIILPEWTEFSYEVYKYEDMKKQWQAFSWQLGPTGLSIRNFGMWISDRDYLYFVDLNCVPRSSLDTFLLNIKGVGYLPTDLFSNNIAALAVGPISYVTERGHSRTTPSIQEMSFQNAIIARRKVGFMVYYNDFSNHEHGDELSDFMAFYAAKIASNYSFLDLTTGSFSITCHKRYTPMSDVFRSMNSSDTVVIKHLEKLIPMIAWKGNDFNTMGEDTARIVCPGRFYDNAYEVYQQKIECCFLQLSTLLANLFTYTFCEQCMRLPDINNKFDAIFKNVSKSYTEWLLVYYNRHSLGAVNYGQKLLYPIASRSNFAPSSSLSTCAFMTISTNEKILLPLWLRNLQRHIPARDIFIFDHRSTDNSTHPSNLNGSNIIYLLNDQLMPVHYRSYVVHLYQGRFLRAGFKCVFFSDTDEIVFVNPVKYPNGLHQYFEAFAKNTSRLNHRVASIELGHMNFGNGSIETREPPFNFSDPYIFRQRTYYTEHPQFLYNKPLLTKVPILYRPGFHHPAISNEKIYTDLDLHMIHMASFDYDNCMQRNKRNYETFKAMKYYERAGGYADHWGTYETDYKSGKLCRFSNLGFFGELKNDTVVYENKGIISMKRIPDEYKNILI